MIQSQGYTKTILPSSLCAGYPKGEKDACLVSFSVQSNLIPCGKRMTG